MFVCLIFLASAAQAAGELVVEVSPRTMQYESGKEITYTVTVQNTTTSRYTDISVQDLLWDTTATTESGSAKTFSELAITSSHSWGSDAGSYPDNNTNLKATGVTLAPLGKVTYTFVGKVSDEITGSFELNTTKVTADIDGDGVGELFVPSTFATYTPVPYSYSVDLSVDKAQYQINQTLVYTLRVTNTGSYAVRGLDISQPFASLVAENSDGVNIATFSDVAIVGSKTGSESELGNYSAGGDLSVTDAMIGLGGTLTYTITVKVSDGLVGDIITSASAHTKDGDVSSNVITTPPIDASVSISQQINHSQPYLINGERVFTVKVENTGLGIAHDYHVKHNIASLESRLGLGNNLQPAFNHEDVSGNLFVSWKIKVIDSGANTTSAYLTAGEQSNIDFDDTVSIYPGESITYEILATLSQVAIGNIQGANAALFDNNGKFIEDAQISDSIPAEKVLNVEDPEIKLKKTTNASQYTPGNEVIYDIYVSNSSSKYFANNLAVIDDMTCIQTEQAGGAGPGQAFSEWKLDVVSGEDALGSDPGTYNYGTWLTSPVTVSPDIAPGKEIHYKLTAKVSDTSVGLILDNNPACSDNITEDGSGIQMPEDNLRASKDVDTRYYSSGDTLTYTIRIDNDGDGYANQVRVVDDVSKVETVDIHGSSINAFRSWTITAQAFHADGTVATSTDTGVSGSITSPDILDVEATIEPHSYIVYTIQAQTEPLANGHIQNSVTVDDTVYADRGSDPKDFSIALNKTVKTNTDTGFHGDKTSYSKLENEISYQLHVKNEKGNGFATNVKVKDAISSIQAGILEPDSQSKPVFKSWTISAEIISDNSLLNGNATYTDVGTFSDNADLDTVAQIPPNVEVVYTIIGQIDRSNEDEIIYKKIENTATVETPDSDSQSETSDRVVVYPKEPNVVVIKTTPDEALIPGQWVTFDITVYNRGAGYANEVSVNDDIIGLDAFSKWTITSNTDDNNTPHKTGSYAGSKSNYPDNGNINTKIDIDPKTPEGMGFVSYTVYGLVKNDYAKPEIANTVEIHDPVNDLDQSASAEIGGSGLDSLNVSILKTADVNHFVPGQFVEYSIILLNNSPSVAAKLKVVDPLTAIKSVLANKKDNHFADFEDQSPFEYWQFDYGDGAGWHGKTNEDLIYPEGDKTQTFSLAGGAQRVLKIRAKIKDNVIGSRNAGGILEQKIANDAYVYREFGYVSQKSHVSHHEMEKAQNGADVDRKLYVNGKESRYYAPGDTLKYTVKVSSQTGYENNHRVTEDIKGVQVQLLDGSKANPFNDTFTVAVERENDNGGDGTTDGKLDGTVANNTNIDTTIDVAGKDYVLYTVEGVVREDATGDITIGGITVNPYEYHLKFSKTVDQKNYEPGQNLVYHLTVSNDGKGNAYQIALVDRISSIKTELLDGSTGFAFNSGWTIEPAVVGGSKWAQVDLDGTIENNKDIDTHISVPAGETIDYKITAKVNSQAVGSIVNLLSVDGDTVSAETKPNTQKFDFEKHVTKYLDKDGVTELSGGYTPGGYVVYQIDLKNKNNVHLKNISIKDDISGITTDYFDGTTGPAFTNWTIKSEVDSSSYSSAGAVSDNSNIDTHFNLAGASFVPDGTYVRYVITAKVSDKAVGEFRNSAVVDGRHTLNSERSSMLPAELKKKHAAYTDATFGTLKKNYNHLPEEQKVVYHLRIDNQGKGTEYNANLLEEFTKLKAKIAQDAAGEVDNQHGIVYEPATWQVSVTKSDEITTNIGKFVGGANLDIDIPKLSIAAGGWIDFKVESQIRDDAMTAITIQPKYNGTRFGKSQINPDKSKLDVAKEIVSIGGRPYSSGATYKPGEEVVYRFTVANTEPVWRDNSVLKDLLSAVTVEVLGGGVEPAFSHTEITHTISQGIDSDVDTYLPRYDTNGDLDIVSDIAPGETITFTIKGTIRDDALGVIAANRATGGQHSVDTDEIPPVAPNLTFNKVVTNTTADGNHCTFPSSTGTGCEYNPSGQVEYQVSIENNGEGIANDVHVVDKLNAIMTSTGAKAFNSISTTIIEQPPADRFSITGNYHGNKPLDATFDLMSGDKVVFALSGTVDDDATGTITNIAKVNNLDSNEVLLAQGDAEVLAMKMTDTPTYTPGGEVRYSMYIANKADTNADVQVLDEISKFQVETADGSMQTALESWTISANVISNVGAAHNDISAIPTSGDINALVKLGAATTEPTVVKIDVVGKVRADAVGKFGNTLYVDGKQYSLQQHFIYPVPGAISVDKEPSISPAVYAPGDEIGFDIVVENTGAGYAKNVRIEDLVTSVRADAVGSIISARVFDKWDPSKSTVKVVDAGSSKTHVISETSMDATDAFSGVYNLAPGSKIELHLVGTVAYNIVGEIRNQVDVTADDIDAASDDAIYQPVDAVLSVSKVVDKPVYLSGDTLTYTIVITNTTRAWASGVQVQDFVNRITAESIHGDTISAFESGSIQITGRSDKGTLLPTSVDDFIDETIDIAPSDTITVTISGKLKQEIVGDVTNNVSVEFNGNTLTDEAVSSLLVPNITITKTPIDEYFSPGTVNGFKILIENKDAAFANDIRLEDIITNLNVDTTEGSPQPAFSNWLVTYKAGDPATEVDVSTYSWNQDIRHTIDLAPNDTIEFTVRGEVNKKAIGIIDNEAKATFDGKVQTSAAQLKPKPAVITISKSADREFYQAGQLAQFKVRIANEGDGFADNVAIQDLMNDVTVSLVDGSTGTAFESWDIDTYVSHPQTTVATMPDGKNPNIDTLADIAPNSYIEFTILGTVNRYATTDIINQAKAKYASEPEQTAHAVIKHRPISLTLNKYVGETGTETEMTYEPGKSATFRVVLANQNEAFVAGIHLKDLISSLKVDTVNGTSEPIFSTWSIKVNKGDALTTVSPDPSGSGKDINATIDLAPNDTVEFVIQGIVNGYAIGRIDNKVTMSVNATRAQRFTAEASLLPEPDHVVITKEADDPIYVAGEQAVFRIKLLNDSKGFANDVLLRDAMSRIKVQTQPDLSTGNREVVNAFTQWNVEVKSSDPRTVVDAGSLGANSDINAAMDIAPGDTVEFIITGTIDPRAMGEIVNTAHKIDESATATSAISSRRANAATKQQASIESVSAMITPRAVQLAVDKTTSKGENAEYTNDDSELTYLLRVSNLGSTQVTGAQMVDEISKLTGSNGNPLFTSWKVSIKEWPSNQIKAEFTDRDLNLPEGGVSLDLLPYMGNGYVIEVKGELNKGLDDDITNTFSVTDPATGSTASDDVTIHVKKFADNEGELSVTKEALKTDAQVGDVIEYEVIIQNNNDSEFKNVKLVDRYPAGFEYVSGSTEITNSGPDGAFDTGDDVVSTEEPAVTNSLTFNIGDMQAYGTPEKTITEQVRVRYLLRVSVGATFGKYVNTAVAMAPPEGQSSGALEPKSKTASATVEVVPDKVFDTASIIGKVFEDHNKDGFQADATASNINVQAYVAQADYVPNSTVIVKDGKERTIKDLAFKAKYHLGHVYGLEQQLEQQAFSYLHGKNKTVRRMDSPLVAGVEVDELMGISSNRTLPESNQVAFQLKTRSRHGFDVVVTTDSGTRIEFDAEGHIKTNYSGDRASGLSAENLNITRNLYKDGDQFLWEIIIENKGIYEDGIPGVRLLTVEGIVIETDQYGRYHVPDQWVLDKKGKQFLIKVDTDSLPTGMKVISENPKVQRISPNQLTKFNFSVSVEEIEQP
ncbi:DUF11 domain-containing protein [Vibrio sp. TRT 17S01]|uniref:DUF11 domain-containing protein n=1 Tax=Vibrio sp. TRT 17S01 TaxID=3418505 RepID=UPI003CF5D408